MDKQHFPHLDNVILFSSKEGSTDTYTVESQKHAKWEKWGTKDWILCDLLY